MSKGWLIGCGIAGFLGVIALCAGIVTIFVGGIFAMTRPVVDASDAFLSLVGQGRIAEAYASTSNEYRANQNQPSFTLAVKKLGLTEFSSASWNNRSINTDVGRTEGTVTTKDGATKSVAIRLTSEEGKWKVAGLSVNGVELVSIKALPPVPAENELERLALESLLDFGDAVRTSDFKPFHAKLAEPFKQQHTPEGLQKVFQEFVDQKVNIAAIKGHKPQFAPAAAVNDNGILTIKGHYPTQPFQLWFDLTYQNEQGTWRLMSIQVQTRKADAPKK